MTNITVYRQSHDFLTTETWHFWLDKTTLILNYYALLKKETKRHKLKVIKSYDRLRTRSSNLNKDDVLIPDDVANEAKQQIINDLKVSK